MFSLPAEDVKLFPIYFYFEWVILDHGCCFGLANFVRDTLFLLRFAHGLARKGDLSGEITDITLTQYFETSAMYRYLVYICHLNDGQTINVTFDSTT